MIYSKYVRDLLVAAALRGGTITFPSTYYLALLTSEPNISTDSYTEIGNINANGYTRKLVANSTAEWAANSSSNAESSNINALVFTDPSGGNWVYGSGTNPTEITHIGFFDSATIGAGNLWFWLPVTPKTVSLGQFNITIPVGALVLRFDR